MQQQAQRLVLGSDLDIAHARALKSELEALPEAAIELDAEAVTRTDASGLQLLLAFIRHREAIGHAVTWHNPSEILNRDAHELGLAHLMNLNNQSEGAQS